MISSVVLIVLFWHYLDLSQFDPGVKISYDILTPHLIINDKVLFASHIYLVKATIILTACQLHLE